MYTVHSSVNQFSVRVNPNNPMETHMFRSFFLLVTSLVVLGLQGCVVVPANGYGNVPANYRPQQAQNSCRHTGCASGYQAWCNGQQPMCSPVQGAPQANNQGCVRTVYGWDCSGPNYRYQPPVIPPQPRRM